MTHGSLSTGLGGFDIGAAHNGIETKWTCEIDPLRRDIIRWLLPNATIYEDMRDNIQPPYVDIVSFGFPCQDISQANPYGKGLDGEKSGLWHVGWGIIRKLRPGFIILENSPILLHKGLRTILGQLAAEGYHAEWDVISCKRFGLPHLRKRLFIVAYTNEVRRQEADRVQGGEPGEKLAKEVTGRQLLQSEFNGNLSWAAWHKTIRSVHHLDDGIPKNILYGLLAAAGDTVSPRITTWIFSRIKEIAQIKSIQPTTTTF